MCYTECGRKKSPIWEANKFKTKEDTPNVIFLFLEGTQNAVLHQHQNADTNSKSCSYREQYPVDQARSGCEMHAVLLPATGHFL
jgi:hypothetical protein